MYVEAGDGLRFATAFGRGKTGIDAVDSLNPSRATFRKLYQFGDCGGPLNFECKSPTVHADTLVELEGEAIATGTLDGPVKVRNAGVWGYRTCRPAAATCSRRRSPACSG